MAQHEADREDLYDELRTAFHRWEIQLPESEVVIAGIRADGRLSIYFGPDRCYHFDEQHRLKRAYIHGLLYRTQGTTLAQLRRERTEAETILNRRDLDPVELADFLREMKAWIANFVDQLERSDFQLLRHTHHDVHTLIEKARECVSSDPPLAPAFAGRR